MKTSLKALTASAPIANPYAFLTDFFLISSCTARAGRSGSFPADKQLLAGISHSTRR
jgi:hypothetical protein